MKKFKEFCGTHGIFSLALGVVVFIVGAGCTNLSTPNQSEITIWNELSFFVGVASYYIIWWIISTTTKRRYKRSVAFLEEYLPLSGKKLYDNKNLIRYSWHWKTKPYKLGKISSFLYEDTDNRDDRCFTFYFNTTKNGSMEIYPYSRKIKASNSMQLVLEKISAKEIFGKLDSDILAFFEMGDLHELAYMEDVQRTINLNAEKALELLGL